MKVVQTQKLSSNFKPDHILSIDQFNQVFLESLFKETARLKNKKILPSLAGKIVCLLFYEPSTRTLASFDSAVKRLGGETIIFNNPDDLSSVAKGETFADTIRVLTTYADALVIRHPKPGMAQLAANISDIPIINAGDGIGEHPTQALLDLFTIWEAKKALSNLKGLLIGDMLNGRTVHSLLKGLSFYKNNIVYLLSPKNLRLPKELSISISKKMRLVEIESFKDIPKNCDFWYSTRIQKERFDDLEEYEKIKNKFILTKNLLLTYGTEKTILLHPLPRVSELSMDLDDLPQSLYFKNQIQNGLYTRMALLKKILV